MINDSPIYTPKLRVLVLTPGLAPGGAEQCLATLIRHSMTVQYVRVIAADMQPSMEQVAIWGCPVTHTEGAEQGVVKAVSEVQEQYDVILYWGLRPMDLSFTGRPVVHCSHGSSSEVGVTPYMQIIGETSANFLAAVSESGIETFSEEARKKTQVQVIHNGADVERTRPIYGRDWQRKQWGLSDQQKVCLYVGRFFDGKGAEVLIESLQYLPEEYVAVLYGWGAQGPQLRRMASKFPGRVLFPQPRLKGLGDVYGAADVVCIPSSSEAFPLVLIEAWQAGVPVVCSEFATIDELEEKHGTALVCRTSCPPSPSELATAIRSWDPQSGYATDDQKIVADALQIALTEYSASAMCGRWESFFYQCHQQWMLVSQFGAVEVI